MNKLFIFINILFLCCMSCATKPTSEHSESQNEESKEIKGPISFANVEIGVPVDSAIEILNSNKNIISLDKAEYEYTMYEEKFEYREFIYPDYLDIIDTDLFCELDLKYPEICAEKFNMGEKFFESYTTIHTNKTNIPAKVSLYSKNNVVCRIVLSIPFDEEWFLALENLYSSKYGKESFAFEGDTDFYYLKSGNKSSYGDSEGYIWKSGNNQRIILSKKSMETDSYFDESMIKASESLRRINIIYEDATDYFNFCKNRTKTLNTLIKKHNTNKEQEIEQQDI